MNKKRKRIEEFVSEYLQIEQQATLLKELKNRLESGEKIGYEGVFHIGEDKLSLSSLSGLNHEELFGNFEDELQIFMRFLLATNEAKMETLIGSVSIKEITPPKKEEVGNSKAEASSPLEEIKFFIQRYESGTVVSPVTIHDLLHETVQNLSLSEVHQVCRDYVEQEKMTIVHQASCHKCSTGFFKVYDVLPKNVICGDCGEDIVNIELHYRFV